MSCYVGGPHGWCDWNGNIGCNSYNIGKYPSAQGVYDEWKLIAKTFPFLELKSQLLNGESCEIEDRELMPAVEYHVSKGKVRAYVPEKLIVRPIRDNLISFLKPGGERGCTLGQFKSALKRVKKMKGK